MKKGPGKRVKRFNFKVLIISIILVFLVAFIGSIFTSSQVNSSWYQQVKPAITPPNWVFPIVWNILFLLIGISLFYAWTSSRDKKTIAFLYAVNLILNAAWSYFYFTLHNAGLAFIDLIGIWITLLILIIYTRKISKKASYLLIPYLVWITFAGILNYLSII
jgi:tryptophan-rich sensory protein